MFLLPAPPRLMLSMNNGKLAPDHICSFNLRAGKHCPGMGACKSWCYAMGFLYEQENAKRVRDENYLSLQRDDFVPRFLDALDHGLDRRFRLAKIARIHDSGDWTSEDHIAKFVAIATARPDWHFYCYTKAHHIFDLAPLRAVGVNVIQSAGGIDDDAIDLRLPHSRIFTSVDELLAAGYTDCSESDLPAAFGASRVGLVIHGQRAGRFNAERDQGRVIRLVESFHPTNTSGSTSESVKEFTQV